MRYMVVNNNKRVEIVSGFATALKTAKHYKNITGRACTIKRVKRQK